MVITGTQSFSSYSFNSGVAKHTFCKICEIKPFYTPRSNPGGIDVNVNCLDTKPKAINVTDFDGKNWEQNAHRLKHKTREAK